MTLSKLSLLDFRNYENQTFEFSAKKIGIHGNNGRGKTNILEAISILSTGKSWREKENADLIRYTDTQHIIPSALIEGQQSTGEQLRVRIEPKTRAFFHGERKCSRAELIGKLPTLLFVPEDLHLFNGEKKLRVSFFDRILIQVYPNYATHLVQAHRALRHKRTLMSDWKKSFHPHDPQFFRENFAPWNLLLAESLPPIIKTREKFITDITPSLEKQWNTLTSNKKTKINLTYNCMGDLPLNSQDMYAFLEKEAAQEVLTGRCVVSPFRDDFTFFINEKTVATHGSRGERRSVLITFLAAQLEIFAEIFHTQPIVLLDDCFSELDAERQKYLQYITEKHQVFFTTTHESHFSEFDTNVCQFITL